MNVPHKKAFAENRSLSQLWKSSYMLFFQVCVIIFVLLLKPNELRVDLIKSLGD